MAYQRAAAPSGPRTKISGVVDAIINRDTQYGTMYSIEVNGKQYGFGKTSPNFGEGRYISFYASQNDKGYWQADARSVTFGENEAGPSSPRASVTVMSQPAPVSRGASVEEKRQASIIYQSSRKDAIEFLKLCKDADVLPIKKSAKSGADYDALVGVLNKITGEFFAAASNPSSGKISDVTPAEAAATEKAAGDAEWVE